MKISKYLHSTVLIEDAGKKLLIDPGTLSFVEKRISPDIFRGIAVIVLTHDHPDHFDRGILEQILKNNPNAQIVSNSDVLDKIKDLPNTILLEDGEQVIEGFKIKGFFAKHEDIGHPCPKNTAYMINDFVLHPGDSLQPVITEHKTKVLAVPVAGPWMTRVMALDLTNNFKPEIVFPIHDVHIKDFFVQWDYGAWQKMMQEKGIEFKPLKEPGDSFEI